MQIYVKFVSGSALVCDAHVENDVVMRGHEWISGIGMSDVQGMSGVHVEQILYGLNEGGALRQVWTTLDISDEDVIRWMCNSGRFGDVEDAGAFWVGVMPESMRQKWRENYTKITGRDNILEAAVIVASDAELQALGYARSDVPEIVFAADRETMWHAHVETTNFTFTGYGWSKSEALLVIRNTLETHCLQHKGRINAEFVEDTMADVQVMEVRPGMGYRDREEVRQRDSIRIPDDAAMRIAEMMAIEFQRLLRQEIGVVEYRDRCKALVSSPPSKERVGSIGTKDGLPAIEFVRQGNAAAGEPSIVSRLQTFATAAARDAALFNDDNWLDSPDHKDLMREAARNVMGADAEHHPGLVDRAFGIAASRMEEEGFSPVLSKLRAKGYTDADLDASNPFSPKPPKV